MAGGAAYVTGVPNAPAVGIDALLRGAVRPFARGQASAIDKRPVDDEVEIGASGLAGDAQADRRHHGGPDKAVHYYPRDHYRAWSVELAVKGTNATGEGPSSRAALLSRPGAFGENVSTTGLTKSDVCVGDLWQLGTALLEVSQARQPCWKLDERFGVPGMARRVQATGRTGWYYRVREPGRARAGDALSLIERPHSEWPLSRILRAFYIDRMDRPTLEGIAGLSVLAPSWRELARRRLASGRVEDWSKRLRDDRTNRADRTN